MGENLKGIVSEYKIDIDKYDDILEGFDQVIKKVFKVTDFNLKPLPERSKKEHDYKVTGIGKDKGVVVKINVDFRKRIITYKRFIEK